MDKEKVKIELKFDTEEIREGAPFAALSYVFCLWILTFIFKKDNGFARFHARQGVVIFIATFACLTLTFVPVFGGLFGFLAFLLVLASFYGIYLSLTGKAERIYFVGEIADKLVI
jgi:uncharacterized membrane protein